LNKRIQTYDSVFHGEAGKAPDIAILFKFPVAGCHSLAADAEICAFGLASPKSRYESGFSRGGVATLK